MKNQREISPGMKFVAIKVNLITITKRKLIDNKKKYVYIGLIMNIK